MPKLTVNRVLVMVFLAGLPSAYASPTPGAGDTQPPDLSVELGRADFLTYCATCHGVGGKGDGSVAEFLTIDAADLTQLRKKNVGLFPRARVIDVVDGRIEVKVHGPRDMPVWGDWFSNEAAASGAGKGTQEEIVRERINALVEYIEKIQDN